jgi:hypothetical protein
MNGPGREGDFVPIFRRKSPIEFWQSVDFQRRFGWEEWTQSIQRSLDVAESVYRVLSDQSARHRTELLELTVILLIAFEIVMAWLRH